MIEARNAGHVESSSPAQWHGARPAPVNPARLNTVPSHPTLSSSDVYASAYTRAKRLFESMPRVPSA